jgi:hypothetical protein
MGRDLPYKPNVNLQRNISKYLGDDIEKEDVYIISLSEKQDDLNMWKKYTDMSPGICVEFDVEKLYSKDIRIEYVLYDKKEQDDFLEGVIKNDVDKADNDFNYSKDLYESLIKAAPKIKHHGFADEKEWRLIIEARREKINFRASGSIILPYYEHRFDKNAIVSITIGPGGNSDFEKQSIQFFCSQHCKNINTNNIRMSGLPYR